MVDSLMHVEMPAAGREELEKGGAVLFLALSLLSLSSLLTRSYWAGPPAPCSMEMPSWVASPPDLHGAMLA